MGGVIARWIWIGSCLVVVGCAPWDLAQLEARHPELARVGSAPLARLVPYFIASADVLTAFTCRWPDGATLGVRVVGEVTSEDERIVDAALAAWNGAGLGVRFERDAREAAVEIGFGDPAALRSGTARVDCRARLGDSDPLDARLVYARLSLRREALNWKGRRVPLSEAERLGAALHELGHALGFQGHPQRGETLMVRSVDHVRWAGESVLRGDPFEDAALAALYALPSGTRLGRWALPPGRTRQLDAELRRARARGPVDWWIRVGDGSARLDWGPGTLPFSVPDVAKIFRNPELFQAIPSSGF